MWEVLQANGLDIICVGGIVRVIWMLSSHSEKIKAAHRRIDFIEEKLKLKGI